jgi:hypothetical protein
MKYRSLAEIYGKTFSIVLQNVEKENVELQNVECYKR